MRTKFLLLLLLANALFFINMTLAQDVFPTANAIWSINSYSDEGEWIYGLSGDTIINDLTYQKLYLLNDTILTIDKDDIYVCGIRQSSKKVYVLPADKKNGEKFEEFLMYDFSKKEGELIEFGKRPLMGDMYYYSTFEIVDISLLFEIKGEIYWEDISQYGRMFYVNISSNIDRWIEGIGSLSGLFFLPGVAPTLKNRGNTALYTNDRLICMKHNDEIKYLDPYCESCFPSYTTNSIKKEKIMPFVIIYDFKEKCIKIKSEDIKSSLVFNVFSIDGKNIFSKRITDVSTSIPVTLLNGVYIYKITGNGLTQSGKIIVK